MAVVVARFLTFLVKLSVLLLLEWQPDIKPQEIAKVTSQKHVVIVGSGPAGLFAALRLETPETGPGSTAEGQHAPLPRGPRPRRRTGRRPAHSLRAGQEGTAARSGCSRVRRPAGRGPRCRLVVERCDPWPETGAGCSAPTPRALAGLRRGGPASRVTRSRSWHHDATSPLLRPASRRGKLLCGASVVARKSLCTFVRSEPPAKQASRRPGRRAALRLAALPSTRLLRGRLRAVGKTTAAQGERNMIQEALGPPH